ncbi:MAG: RluA family pseudouridine synthase [Planctomycetia bacterium]|nr:RluA family pseudouridine synthase [Planctomycetia bacterium]
MPRADLEILYEDNHLLAVNKPAGVPTMGVAAGRDSLLVRAKAYIKRRYQKPGNVYLGAMSRLDAPVSGVVLFARTSKAAARLTEQFRGREVEKVYWALLSGDVSPPTGRLVDFMTRDPRHRRVHRAAATASGAQEARLSYRRLAALPAGTLVEVHLETGRKHQIRLQLSARGWPVLGDRKYGSSRTFLLGIALHSRRLAFIHPTSREPIELVAPLPPAWNQIGVRDV